MSTMPRYEYGFFSSPTEKIVCGAAPTEREAQEKARKLALRLVPYADLYVSDTVWYSLIEDENDVWTNYCVNYNNKLSPTALALHALLDQIDTLSDAIKPSSEEGYRAFYQAALRLANRRSQFVHCPGDGEPTRVLKAPVESHPHCECDGKNLT